MVVAMELPPGPPLIACFVDAWIGLLNKLRQQRRVAALPPGLRESQLTTVSTAFGTRLRRVVAADSVGQRKEPAVRARLVGIRWATT